MTALRQWAVEQSQLPGFQGQYSIEIHDDGRLYFGIEVPSYTYTFVAYPTDEEWFYWH